MFNFLPRVIATKIECTHCFKQMMYNFGVNDDDLAELLECPEEYMAECDTMYLLDHVFYSVTKGFDVFIKVFTTVFSCPFTNSNYDELLKYAIVVGDRHIIDFLTYNFCMILPMHRDLLQESTRDIAHQLIEDIHDISDINELSEPVVELLIGASKYNDQILAEELMGYIFEVSDELTYAIINSSLPKKNEYIYKMLIDEISISNDQYMMDYLYRSDRKLFDKMMNINDSHRFNALRTIFVYESIDSLINEHQLLSLDYHSCKSIPFIGENNWDKYMEYIQRIFVDHFNMSADEIDSTVFTNDLFRMLSSIFTSSTLLYSLIKYALSLPSKNINRLLNVAAVNCTNGGNYLLYQLLLENADKYAIDCDLFWKYIVNEKKMLLSYIKDETIIPLQYASAVLCKKKIMNMLFTRLRNCNKYHDIHVSCHY